MICLDAKFWHIFGRKLNSFLIIVEIYVLISQSYLVFSSDTT